MHIKSTKLRIEESYLRFVIESGRDSDEDRELLKLIQKELVRRINSRLDEYRFTKRYNELKNNRSEIKTIKKAHKIRYAVK